MRRPFRFGVTAATTGDLASWAQTARRIESLGFTDLLLPDAARGPAPLPALAAAAAATEALHVGSWVLCEPLRPPGLLTWELRTMHELLSGRFEAGLGAGRPGAELDAAAFGVDYGSAGARVERLSSTLRRLRDELPALRLLVAAAGPRMLRLAGRLADTVALAWPPDTDLDRAREVASLVSVADGSATPELAAGLIAVGDTAAPWLTHLSTTAADLASHDAVSVLTGTPRQMADTLRRRRDAVGITYWTVPAESASAFGPVIGLLR